jgi:L-alanine-DL-glutamate epimerase-like enolase superfamily enzyme
MYKELFGTWDDSAASWIVPEKPGLGFTISEAVIKDYSISVEKST